jgi:hypothetical protein
MGRVQQKPAVQGLAFCLSVHRIGKFENLAFRRQLDPM